jgi:hypothetical protein
VTAAPFVKWSLTLSARSSRSPPRSSYLRCNSSNRRRVVTGVVLLVVPRQRTHYHKRDGGVTGRPRAVGCGEGVVFVICVACFD